MIAKAGLGLVGIGAISIGGIAVSKPHWLGMDYMPSYKSLADLASPTTTYGTGKFGNKNGRYFVSNIEDNQSWWEWSFRRLHKHGVSSGSFKLTEKVDSGFKKGSQETSKTLGKVCDEAYKANATSVKKGGAGSGEYEEEHVWKYCSPLGGKPKTIKESATSPNPKIYEGSKLGKTKEEELISITDPANNKFWEIRDKEFRKEPGYKPLNTDGDDAFFNPNKSKSIKDLCGDAYGKDGASNSSEKDPTENQTLKYCALEK